MLKISSLSLTGNTSTSAFGFTGPLSLVIIRHHGWELCIDK
jgi:hypothetical protein